MRRRLARVAPARRQVARQLSGAAKSTTYHFLGFSLRLKITFAVASWNNESAGRVALLARDNGTAFNCTAPSLL